MINSNEGQLNELDIEEAELPGVVSIENAEAFATAVGLDSDQIHEGADIEDLASRTQAELQEIATRTLEIAKTADGKPGSLARASVFADAATKGPQ